MSDVIGAFSRPPAFGAPPSGLDELTPRELEVLRLVARGLDNAEIAADLSSAKRASRHA